MIETKRYEVEMWAFMSGDIRPVDVPMEELNRPPLLSDEKWREYILERVFYWGQNDFQPLQFCSVSVGDVVRYEGERFAVGLTGFYVLAAGEIPDPFGLRALEDKGEL